ncbi:hypothetical protein PUN28_016577 [Cardiocondyla obscurior]|uniref:Uncharacterized protein n=1 Tax=Cardiocondyla obscurior TaxID=286306 RepID=A0AAW2EMV5_9HYME
MRAPGALSVRADALTTRARVEIPTRRVEHGLSYGLRSAEYQLFPPPDFNVAGHVVVKGERGRETKTGRGGVGRTFVGEGDSAKGGPSKCLVSYHPVVQGIAYECRAIERSQLRAVCNVSVCRLDMRLSEVDSHRNASRAPYNRRPLDVRCFRT